MKQFREGQWIILLMIWMALLASCNSNAIYDHTKSIDNNVWKQGEFIRFDIDIKDTVSSCDFYLNVRHSTDYEYSNVYFFITTTFPDGKYAKDTVELILADKSGKWIGNGLGKLRENKVLLQENIRFPVGGLYRFEFEQAMREAELKGITDVGLTILKK